MALKNFVLPIPLSSIDSSTFSGVYQLITPAAGLPKGCEQICITNNSNLGVKISYDGVTDHDFVRSQSDKNYQFQANSGPSNYFSVLAQGTKIYALAAGPGIGFVFISGWYQPEGT